MRFTVIELSGETKSVYCKYPKDKTLGDFFHGHSDDIKAIQINDEFIEDWQNYVVKKTDRITVFPKVENFVALILSILFLILSIVLAPKPEKPKTSKSQPSVGVAGISNTIAPGTPKFISYGTRKVFGHLIASLVDVEPSSQFQRADTSRKMNFSALYYMGVGKIASMSEVKINETHLCDIYGPPKANFRLGTQDQTIIPKHELAHQVYTVGQELEIPLRRSKSLRALPGRPYTYTTRGKNVNRVTFFFNFPSGLWQLGMDAGATYKNYVDLRILRKLNSSTSWTDLGLFRSIKTSDKSGFFWKVQLDLPEAGCYDFQINVEKQNGHGSWGSGPSMNIFDVLETKYITTSYPGNALLEVNGIANDQINSLDNMAVSAIVQGRLVDVLVNGIYVKQFSRNRVWIIRDILFDRNVGLGNRLNPSMWDNASGQKAADYYEEQVLDYQGNLENRDYCDLIINEQRPGWDWIKTLLFEGKAIIFSSGGKLKYVLNRDAQPNLLYSSPGNIIENTLQLQRGNTEKTINTIRAEFPSASDDYKVLPAKIVTEDKGDDPERLESISLISITRTSQAARLMKFRLGQLTQIKRHWSWKSPSSAVISEPFDITYLNYNVNKFLRGYAGFIKGDQSTTTSVVADRSIYLANGTTHSIYVKHDYQGGTRQITNALGNTYSILTFSPALDFTPENGDIFTVTKTENQLAAIQIESVDFDGHMFTMVAHEHLSSIYDDSLVDVTSYENASGTSTSVIPLLDAQARYYSVGGVTTGYIFNVVPGFSSLVGTYSILTGNTVTLGYNEVSRDNYFLDAYLTADVDSALKVTDYDGTSKIATVASNFVAAMSQSGIYSIAWPFADSFYGFQVEGLNGSTWSLIDSTIGTTLTTISATTYSSFRFSPTNSNEVGNTNSQVIVSEGIVDSTPPDTPLSLYIATDPVFTGIATVELLKPLDRDIQYLEVEFISGLTQGDTSLRDKLDVSIFRNELDTSGTLSVDLDIDLDTFAAGTTFSARASTLDFFGNRSSWINSFNEITLSTENPSSPTDNEIPTGGGTTYTITGSSTSILFSDIITGGLIGNDSSIRLDLNLLVTPGSTQTTTIDFSYMFANFAAATITSQISNNSSKIGNNTPYWLTFLISPINGSYLSQDTTAKKTGEEIPSNDVRTFTSILFADTSVDKTMEILARITGDTSSTIKVIKSSLTQITDDTTVEPYIVAGTVPTVPTASSTVLVHPFALPATFSSNLPGSYGYAKIPIIGGTQSASFSLRKNNTEFGTMTYSPSTAYATFVATQTSFIAGDILTVITPSSGGTVSTIGWSILGRRD